MCVCARVLTLTTGMTWVTPSPLSMTVPVSVLSPTCRDVQEAARARTAWQAHAHTHAVTHWDHVTVTSCFSGSRDEPDLHGDVQSRYVEGFKHDLSRILSVFWCVQRRFCLEKNNDMDTRPTTTHDSEQRFRAENCPESHQQEVVVLRLRPQVLEDDLLHEALHEVPVFHYPVTDRPLLAPSFSLSGQSQNVNNVHKRGVVQSFPSL